MAKVVYTDWKDRINEPEIIGVYEDDAKGYYARQKKEEELAEENYDTDEEVRVWIEDITIQRSDTISEKEIDLVMQALSGSPVVTSAKFADKIERILKRHMKVISTSAPDATYAQYYSDIEKKIVSDGYVPETSMENLISMILLHFDSDDNYGEFNAETGCGGYGNGFTLEECFRYVKENGGYSKFDYEP